MNPNTLYVIYDPYDRRHRDNIHCFTPHKESKIEYDGDLRIKCVENLFGYEIHDDNPLTCYSGYLSISTWNDRTGWIPRRERLGDFSTHLWDGYHQLFVSKKGQYNIKEHIIYTDHEDEWETVYLCMTYVDVVPTPLERVIDQLMSIKHSKNIDILATTLEDMIKIYSDARQ